MFCFRFHSERFLRRDVPAIVDGKQNLRNIKYRLCDNKIQLSETVYHNYEKFVVLPKISNHNNYTES